MKHIKPAVLIIDMEEEMSSHIQDLSGLVQRQSDFLKQLSRSSRYDTPIIPVSWTQTLLPEISAVLRQIPVSCPVIKKYSMSSFDSDNLETVLHSFDVNSLFLIGVNKSECVYHTAKDAIPDYKIFTALDVIADAQNVDMPSRQLADKFFEKHVVFDSYRDFLRYL